MRVLRAVTQGVLRIDLSGGSQRGKRGNGEWTAVFRGAPRGTKNSAVFALDDSAGDTVE